MLPTGLSPAAFDDWHDDLPQWRGTVEALACRHAQDGEALHALDAGTVLVVLIGQRAVFKLYPPFLRDHFEFERAALSVLGQQGLPRFPVPLPVLLASGEESSSGPAGVEHWPWLLMSQLPGEVLTPHWRLLAEPQRCSLLQHIGEVMAALHDLPPVAVTALRPVALCGGDWPAWLARQRAGCLERQRRTGLPGHLLAQLQAFVDGPVPVQGASVLLTGEYTPMNLLISPASTHRLSGMFDFGDGLLGARMLDWLGPLAFLAAGHAPRVQALLNGYGEAGVAKAMAGLSEDWRRPALRLLLLHRYSNLRAQLALPGWETSPSFETLADRLWPTS